jgi:hypothetical protein
MSVKAEFGRFVVWSAGQDKPKQRNNNMKLSQTRGKGRSAGAVRGGMAMFAVAFAQMAVAATDYVWTGSSASGPVSMPDWADEDNWNPKSIPNSDDALVSVSGGWVSNTMPVTVARVENAGSTTRYISDHQFSIVSNLFSKNMAFFAPLHIKGSTPYLRDCSLAGDMTFGNGAKILVHGGTFSINDNQYAPSSETTWRPSPLGTITEYHGSLSFNGPRGSSAAVTQKFSTQAGSPFVKAVTAGAADTLPIGALVSGAGVSGGTFLRRIFGKDDFVELSQPVSETAAAAELSFAGRKGDCRRYVNELAHNGSTDHNFTINLGKYRMEDIYEVEVGLLKLLTLSGGNRWTRIHCNNTFPGRLILHDTPKVLNTALEVGTCDILFSDAPNTENGPGLPYATVRQGDAGQHSRFSVTGNMEAVIHEFQAIKGSLTKGGVGLLRVGFGEGPHTGALVIEEGTFVPTAEDESCPIEIGSFSITSNAVLQLPVQGLRVTNRVGSLAGGVVKGPGKLFFSNVASIDGLTLEDGAEIVFECDGSIIRSEGGETVPGNPAFWVDCSENGSAMTLVDVTNGVKGVTRIEDVRQKNDPDGDYIYSEVCSAPGSGYFPELRTDTTRNIQYVHIEGNFVSGSSSLADSDTHRWSKPVKNIRHVFQVMAQDRWRSGGNFLGIIDTQQTGTGAEAWAHYNVYTGKIFDWGTDAIKQGKLWINGVLSNPDQGYPYPAYENASVKYFVPIVLAFECNANYELPGADSYEYNTVRAKEGRIGHKCLGELIVYTNALTVVECKQIMAYLTRKWQTTEICYAPIQTGSEASLGTLNLGEGSGGIGVKDGAELMVDRVTGAGTLAKTGNGTLLVPALPEDGSVSFLVKEGTLEIQSVAATENMLPAGAWARYDASNLNNLEYTVENGVTNILKWLDSASGEHPASHPDYCTNYPTLRTSTALGGMPYVDFGEAKRWEKGGLPTNQYAPSAPVLSYASTPQLHTVIAVWGADHGGGNLVGTSAPDSQYWSSVYTIVRAGETSGPLGGDRDQPVVRSDMLMPKTAMDERGMRFHKNGVACDPRQTGLSAGFNIVSWASYENFGGSALTGVASSTRYAGGEQFAEYMLYEKQLSTREVALVEAYLRQKWFGQPTPEWNGTKASKVAVSNGATLKVVGNAPLSVETLSLAGGTISGGVALQSAADLEAAVNADGTVTPVTVDGTIDFSKGGTVTFTGATNMLTYGSYVLLTGIGECDLSNWSVDTAGLPGRYQNIVLSAAGGSLTVKVVPGGTSIRMK